MIRYYHSYVFPDLFIPLFLNVATHYTNSSPFLNPFPTYFRHPPLYHISDTAILPNQPHDPPARLVPSLILLTPPFAPSKAPQSSSCAARSSLFHTSSGLRPQPGRFSSSICSRWCLRPYRPREATIFRIQSPWEFLFRSSLLLGFRVEVLHSVDISFQGIMIFSVLRISAGDFTTPVVEASKPWVHVVAPV